MAFQLQDSNEAFSGKSFDWDANKGFFKNIADKVYIAPTTEQIGLVKQWNIEQGKAGFSQEAFLSQFDDTDPLKTYFTTLDGGIATQKGMTGALNKTTLASKATTLGMKALSMAMNMALMAGAAWVISKVIEGIQYLATAQQRAIEKSNELTSAWKEQQNSLKNNKETIDGLSESYERLSKGVDQFGNNISLTADEYKQYNGIVTKIADMFPQMVQGYNEQDIAILKHKGNIEELTKALNEQTKAANSAIVADGQEAFDGFKAKSSEYQKELEDIRKAMAFMNGANTFEGKDFGDKWSQSDFFDKYGIETSVWDLSFNGNGSNDSVKLDHGGEEERNAKQVAYNRLLSDEQATLEKIAGIRLEPNSVIQAFLELQAEYVGLDDSIQDMTSALSSSLDIKDFDYDATKMQAHIQSDILVPIYENKDNIQSALHEVLNVDPSEMTIVDIDSLNKKLEAIKDSLGLSDNDFSEFKIRLGIFTEVDLDQLERIKEEITSTLGENTATTAFQNLNFAELQEFDRQLKQIAADKGDVNKYANSVLEWKNDDKINYFLKENQKLLEEGKLSYSTYNKKLGEFAEKLGLTGKVYEWFIGLFQQELPPMPDLNPIVDKYQEAIKSTESMLGKLKDGSLTNDEVMDFMQANPNLDWSGIDFGQADFGNLREVLEKEAEEGIYQGVMNSIEDSYGALEKHRQEVQDKYNSSDKTDEDLKAFENENRAIDNQLVLLDQRKSYLENDHQILVSTKELEDARKATDNLVSSAKSLSSAFEEQRESGRLSAETILGIVDAGYASALQVDQETGAVTINQQAYIALAQAKIQEQIVSLQAQRNSIVSELIAEAKAAKIAAGGHLTNAQAIQIENAAKSSNANIQALDAQIEALNQIDLSRITSGLYHVGNAAKSAANEMKQAMSSAQSAINSLLTMTMNMIKQNYANQKDGLEDLKDAEKDRYDATRESLEKEYEQQKKNYDLQKQAIEDATNAAKENLDLKLKALQAEKDAYYWNKELSKQNKSVADLEADISTIGNDDSEEGIAKRRELEALLAKEKEKLADMQFEHSVEMQEKALNGEYDLFEEKQNNKLELLDQQNQDKEELHQAELERLELEYNTYIDQLDAKIKAIDEYTKLESNIRAEAIKMIEDKNSELYQKLLKWNKIYGTSLDADVKVAWNNAQTALGNYNSAQLGVKGVLELLVTKMDEFERSTKNAAGAMQNLAKEASNVKKPEAQTPETATSIRQKIQYAIKQKNWSQDAKEKKEIQSYIDELQEQLKNATYHTGGFVTKGSRAIDDSLNLKENETVIKAKVGEYVIPTEENMANKAALIPYLINGLPNLFETNSGQNIEQDYNATFKNAIVEKTYSHANQRFENPSNYDINLGDIIIQGNADKSTVMNIKKVTEDIASELLRNLSHRGVGNFRR